MLGEARLRHRSQDQLFTWTAVTVTGLIVAAQIASHLVDFGVYDLRISVVNANSDGNLFSWVGALAAAAAFAAATVDAVAAPAGRAERSLLAAILGFVVIDNRLHVHDHIELLPLVYVPLLGVAAVLMWRMVAAHSREERLTLLAGVASLGISLVIHELGPPLLARLGWGPGEWMYQVKIALKEATELTGWLLVAFALTGAARAELLARRGVRPVPR